MPLINYTLLRTGVGTLPGHFTTRADVYQAGKGCGKTMPPNNFPESREWLRQCRLLGHTPSNHMIRHAHTLVSQLQADHEVYLALT